MKNEFRFEDYTEDKGKYVMYCMSKQEEKEFCELMDKNDFTWWDKTSYLEDRLWTDNIKDICYNFNNGTCCQRQFYEKEGYTILKWSDFTNTSRSKQESNSDEETETLKEKLERLIKLEKKQMELESEIQSIRNMRYKLLRGKLTDKFI